MVTIDRNKAELRGKAVGRHTSVLKPRKRPRRRRSIAGSPTLFEQRIRSMKQASAVPAAVLVTTRKRPRRRRSVAGSAARVKITMWLLGLCVS